jgi:hypothetical protein
MPHWLLKAAVQRGLGVLPNSHRLNEVLQRWVTHSLDLTPERFLTHLDNCRIHVEHLRRWGLANGSAFSVFDLGTGWHPVVPIGLFLCGAREVWTWDIVRHVNMRRSVNVLQQFIELARRGVLHHYLPELIPERLERLREATTASVSGDAIELLNTLNIRYCVGDASASRLPHNSVDLIVSFGVFEYLSVNELTAILEKFRRIARPDAVMSHWIDLRDQYAHFDPCISRFNFLQYSDRAWRLLNNPIISLNRLRINDYRSLLRKVGFTLVDEDAAFANEPELACVPLAPRFSSYPTRDLLALHAWLVAVPGSADELYA